MLVGHLAAGFVAKRMAPEISLGTGVLASVAADLLWCIFLLAGIEHVHIKPGMGAANYFDASVIAMSHSLLMDVVWAALFAGGYYFWRRYPRGAWVLFAAFVTHWLLDFVSHRPDMPLAPGLHMVFGLGLWTSVTATVIVEGGLWLLAIILYCRATQPETRAGVYAFWSIIALLTVVWYNNIAGPPPPNAHTAAVASLIFLSFVVAWAYWMNQLRPARS
jgi:hypothetical protein